MWTGGGGLLGRGVGQGHAAPKRCAKPNLDSFASQSCLYPLLWHFLCAPAGEGNLASRIEPPLT